jgi:phosphoglycolate phosphatase
MPVRAVLFDFDGTLADSFPAITASTNHVRRRYGLPELPEPEVRRYVGFGLEHLMRELVPNAPPADAVAAYRAHHPSVMLTGTKLMPGVAETFPVLHRRGLRLGVCSNKRVDFTKQLVRAFGLAEFLDVVLGPEDVAAPKPDPAMLIEAARRLGVSAGDTIYVGDMAVDVQAGQAAGMETWLVLGGAAGNLTPLGAEPDRVLESFAKLAALLPSGLDCGDGECR